MKGVLMLINYFPPVPPDGAERQAERLAIYMAKRDLHVGVLTRKVDDLSSMETRDGFVVFRIPQFGAGKAKAATFTIGAILTILKHRKSFDILHAHLTNSPAVAAAVAGKLLGKRVIVKFGNTGVFGDVALAQRSWRGRFALSLFRNWADACLALSNEMEKEMLEAGFSPAKIIRVVNGVDATEFSPPADKAAAKNAISMNGKTLVLFTGRLVKQKALDVLLSAFYEALKSSPMLHLILAGEGEERKNLEEFSAKLGITAHVTFAGRMEDVTPYLRAADIFVLPSLTEGMSNSLMEALSMGLPCIATRISGSRELLDNGAHGLMVESGDVAQLSAAIVRLASDPQYAANLGARARQHILDHYDFSSVSDQYYRLYQRLLDTGKEQ